MTRSRRGPWVWPGAIAALTGFFVWNLVFDLWVGQGERQYLWERARFRLGEGPGVSLDGSMASSVEGGIWVATAWTIVVVAAVLGASYLAYRAGKRQVANDQ
jgi:hypothetical protein